MSTEQKKLSKPTAEVLREYDELTKKFEDIHYSWSNDEINVVFQRIKELEDQYDWFNVEFTDPITGKKGLKDVAGKVVAPALYDGFCEYQSYTYAPYAPVLAIKDGKCGIIRGDGSGNRLCGFMFDSIHSILFTTLFMAT